MPAFAQPGGGGGVTPGARPFSGGGAVTNPILACSGTAAAPCYSWSGQTDLGFFKRTSTIIDVTGNGVAGLSLSAAGGANSGFIVNSAGQFAFSATTDPDGGTDLVWRRDAANTSDQRNGTNPQFARLANTWTDINNNEYGESGWVSNIWTLRTVATGTGTARAIRISPSNGDSMGFNESNATWNISGGVLVPGIDATRDIGINNATRVRDIFLTGPSITKAASQAAGGTVNTNSLISHLKYQVTVAPAAGDCSTAFIAAALTADCTIATLPAGMKLVGVYADVTAGFTCSGTCTGTKVLQCGTAAGGTQILAASLNVVATGTFGLADADLGSGMTRAAAIQGGLVGSWSATTPVSCRFTSGTGNWGSGAATFVNAGTVKFTLLTELVK